MTGSLSIRTKGPLVGIKGFSSKLKPLRSNPSAAPWLLRMPSFLRKSASYCMESGGANTGSSLQFATTPWSSSIFNTARKVRWSRRVYRSSRIDPVSPSSRPSTSKTENPMTTVSDVAAWLEQFAPARLAEPWNNVGLNWGAPAEPVQKVMTCLTVTPTTAAEAIHERAGLIVSHHPILFREVKKIRADLPETGYLWKLARAGIAVASPHTAFDNTHNGINDLLCQRLGLGDVVPLRAAALAAPRSVKGVVFQPEPERDPVSSAAFQAGAGLIGAYEECSFAIPGEGTFFGTESANPSVGQRGVRETVRELRLEFVCPAAKLAGVLAAIRTSHTY